MKFSYQALAFSIYVWGLLTIGFAIFLPAQAAIACEPGTISNYANNSLAACNLDQDMTVQLFSSSAGTSSFYCRAKKYIFFDDKGQFQSCQLAQDIQIRQANSITTCPAEYRVYVSVLNNGILSINCSPE
ncbi:hypothetical protein IQ243_25470 [Nostocales cyanobacterium LEGE 11386]|nr:hypothetical protein [Nostocales cyanobacterium LEGE 11386]